MVEQRLKAPQATADASPKVSSLVPSALGGLPPIKTLEACRAAKQSWNQFLQPGDQVDEAFVDAALGAVPPATHTSQLVQMGEPHSWEGGKDTFLTFKKTDLGWVYAGPCWRGCSEPMPTPATDTGALFANPQAAQQAQRKAGAAYTPQVEVVMPDGHPFTLQSVVAGLNARFTTQEVMEQRIEVFCAEIAQEHGVNFAAGSDGALYFVHPSVKLEGVVPGYKG